MGKKLLYNMKKKNKLLLNEKKGISAVVTAVIMIALVMTLAIIVWQVLTNLVEDSLAGTKSCFNIVGKIEINDEYTCYNTTKPSVQFSIKMSDIDVDGIVVLISSAAESKSFTLTNSTNTDPDLFDYTWGSLTSLPGKNNAKTYHANNTNQPDSIEVSVIINDEQCPVSDSVTSIDDCKLFA